MIDSVDEKTTGSFQTILKSIIGDKIYGNKLFKSVQRERTETASFISMSDESISNVEFGERHPTVNLFSNLHKQDSKTSKSLESKNSEDSVAQKSEKKADDGNDLMKVCFYNHIYQKEINSMIVLNHAFKYSEFNVTEVYLSSSKVLFWISRFQFFNGLYFQILNR